MNESIFVEQETVDVPFALKLIAFIINDKRKFNESIRNIYSDAANKFKALIQLKNISHFEEKKTISNFCSSSSLKYCLLVHIPWNTLGI